MKYSKEEVIQYVQEEDVKFIRLALLRTAKIHTNKCT